MTDRRQKIGPVWGVSEIQIKNFSSTMVKVWLWQKTKIRPFWSFWERGLVLYLFFGSLDADHALNEHKKYVYAGWNSGAILGKAGKAGKGSPI